MSYRKGVFAERELIHYLNSKGFAVIRSPSSGSHISPIDIVAIKRGLVIAIESKAWKAKPKPDKKQLKGMREWCDKAGAIGFIGWRNEGRWLFLRLEDAEAGKYDGEQWMEIHDLLSLLELR